MASYYSSSIYSASVSVIFESPVFSSPFKTPFALSLMCMYTTESSFVDSLHKLTVAHLWIMSSVTHNLRRHECLSEAHCPFRRLYRRADRLAGSHRSLDRWCTDVKCTTFPQMCCRQGGEGVGYQTSKQSPAEHSAALRVDMPFWRCWSIQSLIKRNLC